MVRREEKRGGSEKGKEKRGDNVSGRDIDSVREGD